MSRQVSARPGGHSRRCRVRQAFAATALGWPEIALGQSDLAAQDALIDRRAKSKPSDRVATGRSGTEIDRIPSLGSEDDGARTRNLRRDRPVL